VIIRRRRRKKLEFSETEKKYWFVWGDRRKREKTRKAFRGAASLLGESKKGSFKEKKCLPSQEEPLYQTGGKRDLLHRREKASGQDARDSKRGDRLRYICRLKTRGGLGFGKKRDTQVT